MSALLKLVVEVNGVRVLAGTTFQPCFGTHKEERRSEGFMTKTSTKTKGRRPRQVSTLTQGWKFWIREDYSKGGSLRNLMRNLFQYYVFVQK